ncbi:MAG: hypothetical protein FADNKDHG_01198 [Holosporales bacterium]
MKIEKYNYDDLSLLFGIHAKLLPIEDVPIFAGSMIGTLKKNEATKRHAHHEKEIFCIIKGKATVIFDNEIETLKVGDMVHFEACDPHILYNLEEEPLIFLSMWWFDAQGAILTSSKRKTINKEKQFIFAPPPTPNGDLHLGHLSGPYLASDIFKRHQTQKLKPSTFIVGTDDFQSYVSLKAKIEKRLSYDVAKTYSNRIKDVFDLYQIQPDIFYTPLKDENYQTFVARFFEKCSEQKIIHRQKIQQAFCTACNIFLHEAHIGGQCYHCFEQCGGGACENCGVHQNNKIKNSFCKYCKTPPILKETEQFVFPLSIYQEQVKKKLEESSLPTHVRKCLKKIFEEPLENIPVTYDTDWGIDVLHSKSKTFKLCSWMEMIAAYLYFFEQDTKNNQKSFVFFFGFDNSFFYTVIMIAFLIRYLGDDVNVNFVVNEFYLFNKLKFSKSRSHTILAKNMAKIYNIDALRYFLSLTRPETIRTDFCLTSLEQTIHNDLIKNLSEWIVDLSNCLNDKYDNKCPDGGEITIEHQKFLFQLNTVIKACSKFYQVDYFSPINIVKNIQYFLSCCQTLKQSRHHNTTNAEHRTFIALELTALKYFCMICYPIMPHFCKKLYAALGQGDHIIWQNEIRMIVKDTKIYNLKECYFEYNAKI